jgi:O-antigen ligase
LQRMNWIFTPLLILVCWMPLPFGSVQPWAWSLMVIITGGLLVAWGAEVAIRGKRTVHVQRRLKWSLIGYLLVASWALFQISSFAPAAWHHPIWLIAAEALPAPGPGRIAIDPQAGMHILLRLISYAAIFWLAFQTGHDRGLAKFGLGGIAVASGATVAIGMMSWLMGWDDFLWFSAHGSRQASSFGSRLAMPFVNPNHLSSLAGIGLVCAAGFLVGETRGLWRLETPRQEKLRRFLEMVVAKYWYVVVSGLVLAAALIMSISRGGFVAAAFGFIALVAALLRQSRPKASFIFVIVLGTALAVIALFGPGLARLLDRVDQNELGADQRIVIYENSLDAIAASPWLGYGLGSFKSVYRMYDQSNLTTIVDAAHNSFLENTLELGIIGGLVLFATIMIPVIHCWNGAVLRRQDQHIPAVGFAVSILCAAHSLVDFPMQIPAIAASFAFILGIGCAQSLSSRVAQGAPSLAAVV